MDYLGFLAAVVASVLLLYSFFLAFWVLYSLSSKSARNEKVEQDKGDNDGR